MTHKAFDKIATGLNSVREERSCVYCDTGNPLVEYVDGVAFHRKGPRRILCVGTNAAEAVS